MTSKAPPFKGLNTRIPIIIPFTGRGFMNQGSGLQFCIAFNMSPDIDCYRVGAQRIKVLDAESKA